MGCSEDGIDDDDDDDDDDSSLWLLVVVGGFQRSRGGWEAADGGTEVTSERVVCCRSIDCLVRFPLLRFGFAFLSRPPRPLTRGRIAAMSRKKRWRARDRSRDRQRGLTHGAICARIVVPPCGRDRNKNPIQGLREE